MSSRSKYRISASCSEMIAAILEEGLDFMRMLPEPPRPLLLFVC
jgi:hypothetical protein